MSTVFPFGWLSRLNLPLQGLFDHPKGGYVRGLWKDMFLRCERSIDKSLTDHFLRDDSRLEEDMPRQ